MNTIALIAATLLVLLLPKLTESYQQFSTWEDCHVLCRQNCYSVQEYTNTRTWRCREQTGYRSWESCHSECSSEHGEHVCTSDTEGETWSCDAVVKEKGIWAWWREDGYDSEWFKFTVLGIMLLVNLLAGIGLSLFAWRIKRRKYQPGN